MVVTAVSLSAITPPQILAVAGAPSYTYSIYTTLTHSLQTFILGPT